MLCSVRRAEELERTITIRYLRKINLCRPVSCVLCIVRENLSGQAKIGSVSDLSPNDDQGRGGLLKW